MMIPMFSLTDKTALVTGAASGIGEAIARTFAAAGAAVYVADVNIERGEAVAEAINGHFIETNVASESSCRAAADRVLKEQGKLDVLVNNAGIGHVGTVLSTTEQDLDRLYAVNVKGPHFLTQAFLPSMIERKWASVIHMASIGGIVGVRDRYAYCMTKFAVVGLTKSMALDLAEHKIRVNCICPGRVETPFVQQRIAEYPDPKKAYEEMASTQLLKRMAQPNEIAAAALYLAADESAFVTGSSLIIDGGFSTGK
jgi:2-keto-3-deoxy-L-fuconate dehydrogenase